MLGQFGHDVICYTKATHKISSGIKGQIDTWWVDPLSNAPFGHKFKKFMYEHKNIDILDKLQT